MTLQRLISVRCDDADCFTWRRFETDSLEEARALAAKEGWVSNDDGEDYCQKHDSQA